ncbi:Bug family tripartite tricarboxylate transporter substrate binding protein [Falsiroseomonas tokyonensis]|uniref:Bug family tripartite tricarboxylate transporter substrate binding protein n=1 Tax=Falsiroseomonas tokyonensis TaxID=430521 RepID=A0ABV7BU16_9PROT|nr:tripartite tricarboxylate transporter substrate binding protein [Falsiroseomonas tokyonensis]MBU8537978.1 tripartite tricarboxylate transporter substrate binding protein [Falsiroseomonas tokyonensis]
MKLRHRLLLPLLGGLLAAMPALAQDNWPSRPIEFLGGFPNGSGVDIYARRLAAPLSQALGVPVVVNNRVGAGGNIASDYAAKARPDGYLILFGTAGTHAINATLYRRLPFDPMRDVTHIAHLGDVPNVLITSIQHRPQYTSCAALVADAKARPGALNYASTGNGASTHLAGAVFARAAGIDMLHIPFPGQGPAVTSLLGGQTDLFFNQVGPAIGLIQQGAVRALGVTTPQRLAALPDVPTIAEACNLPGFESTTWYGVFGPPGMPAAIQQRLNTEIRKIIEAPDFRDWLVNNQGISPSTIRTPEEFRRVHEQDIARWGEVIRAAGAQVD